MGSGAEDEEVVSQSVRPSVRYSGVRCCEADEVLRGGGNLGWELVHKDVSGGVCSQLKVHRYRLRIIDDLVKQGLHSALRR